MKRRILALVSGSMLALQLAVGAASAQTPGDAHDRSVGATPKVLIGTSVRDAHDRSGQTLLPDGRALRLRIAQLDAHSRAGIASPSGAVSSYVDAAGRTSAGSTIASDHVGTASSSNGFEWGDAGIGAGVTLLLVGVLGLTLIGMRHGRGRMAVP